jgi:inorganic pyrophosphatase
MRGSSAPDAKEADMFGRTRWTRLAAIAAAALIVASAVPGVAFAKAKTHTTAHTHWIKVTHRHVHAMGKTHKHVIALEDLKPKPPVPPVPALTYLDIYNLQSTYDFLRGDRHSGNAAFPLNAVVEIPAGTNAKWETSTTVTTRMFWEFKKGAPRVINYLPYPGDYGSLVNSKAADGDPLDVLVLAPAVPRGTITAVRIIGVLKVSEPGDTPGAKVMDDKLIAVSADSPLVAVTDLTGLDASYPGVKTIIQTWFENYKGAGAMTFEGWGDATEANTMAETVPAFN